MITLCFRGVDRKKINPSVAIFDSSPLLRVDLAPSLATFACVEHAADKPQEQEGGRAAGAATAGAAWRRCSDTRPHRPERGAGHDRGAVPQLRPAADTHR